MRRLASLGLALTALACGGGEPLPPGETEGSVHESVGRETVRVIPPPRRLDLVLVIDDSPSMAGEQPMLANNLATFIDVLEDPELRADYRVAVVRTSGGECSTPPGDAVNSSCLSRPEDFVIPEGREHVPGDLLDRCQSACSFQEIEVLPTPTVRDPTPKPRPWLQNVLVNHRQDNVDVPMTDALACWGMVGVSGCDYESPFEALSRFLASTQDPQSPNYEFLRDDALAYIVFIGDEDDCSLQDPSILDPDGERSFWPADANEDRAPSSVCFRAGVSCIDESEDEWDCQVADRSADGSITANPDEAVLTSVARFRQEIEALDAERRAARLTPWPTIYFGHLGGMTSSGNLKWPKAGGPEGFVDEFGVGPGCAGPLPDFAPYDQNAAAPPTRVHALVDSFAAHNSFSTCDSDYSVALDFLSPGWGPQLRPACFTSCARLDPEPSCTMLLEDRYEDIDVPECERDADGYLIDPDTNDYQVPDGSELCFAYLDDADDSTESTWDDMSLDCVEQGFNLEFKIAVRPTDRIYEGRYIASCLLDVEEGACGS